MLSRQMRITIRIHLTYLFYNHWQLYLYTITEHFFPQVWKQCYQMRVIVWCSAVQTLLSFLLWFCLLTGSGLSWPVFPTVSFHKFLLIEISLTAGLEHPLSLLLLFLQILNQKSFSLNLRYFTYFDQTSKESTDNSLLLKKKEIKNETCCICPWLSNPH